MYKLTNVLMILGFVFGLAACGSRAPVVQGQSANKPAVPSENAPQPDPDLVTRLEGETDADLATRLLSLGVGKYVVVDDPAAFNAHAHPGKFEIVEQSNKQFKATVKAAVESKEEQEDEEIEHELDEQDEVQDPVAEKLIKQ